MGGSAGGLLMGAVANMAPADYRAIVAQVPFVDVVTTMLDESIPLTTNEFDEWGNPKKKEYYDYMLSYSPYDNVAHQAYPAMLVTTGLWDSQVQYYEPAKWVARLRARKTGTNPLLYRTTMEAGHGGKSGRFQRFREIAEEYAFILDQSGIRGIGSMNLGRIEQVAIPVRDLARATAFYRDRLGMKLAVRGAAAARVLRLRRRPARALDFLRPDVRPAGLDRLLPRAPTSRRRMRSSRAATSSSCRDRTRSRSSATSRSGWRSSRTPRATRSRSRPKSRSRAHERGRGRRRGLARSPGELQAGRDAGARRRFRLQLPAVHRLLHPAAAPRLAWASPAASRTSTTCSAGRCSACCSRCRFRLDLSGRFRRAVFLPWIYVFFVAQLLGVLGAVHRAGGRRARPRAFSSSGSASSTCS